MKYAGPWRPRFVYGTGGDITDWAAILPVRPWDRSNRTVGGSRTAAGGTPAAYIVRNDRVLAITLRLYESEVGAFDSFMAWAQADESFLWYPDARLDSTVYHVWLEAPKAGVDVQWRRDPKFPRVLETTIELRTVVAQPWTLEYFPVCD